MGSNLIDLRQAKEPSHDDLPGLHAYLAQLVGEPFRFGRVSYGDELTLHFGDLRPARSPKLRHKLYGAYILGLRGSPWILKSGSEPIVITAGEVLDSPPSAVGKPLLKEELEAGTFVEAESRVLTAAPFVVKPVEGFGLQLRMSDGSTLLVLPTIQEPDEPEDEGLPKLADWELSTPRGLLSAGPGLDWSFKPLQPASFASNPSIVRAISNGVAFVRRAREADGWYDSHDLINWLDIHHNDVLNDIIDCYKSRSSDPVHTATIQIGKYLRDHLGQVKVGENKSYHHITLRSGDKRNGDCEVSKWKI